MKKDIIMTNGVKKIDRREKPTQRGSNGKMITRRKEACTTTRMKQVDPGKHDVHGRYFTFVNFVYTGVTNHPRL